MQAVFFFKAVTLYNFSPDELGIGAADGKTFPVLHLDNHATIKMFFNFLQAVDIYNGAAMNTDKEFRIQDLFEFPDTGRADKLIILCSQDSIIARSFQVYDLIDWEVEKLF